MRYAVLTDIHSDANGARRALEAARAEGFDELICLGDVFDYIGPSRPDGESDLSGSSLEYVAAWDAGLAELLAEFQLLRGNHEDRIAAALDTNSIPAALSDFLNAPDSLVRGDVRFAHGHYYPWDEVESDRWVPLRSHIDERVLVHGHHHRSSVLGVPRRHPSWENARDCTPPSGTEVSIAGDESFLVNVGAARGDQPSWGLVDLDRLTVTLWYAERRRR